VFQKINLQTRLIGSFAFLGGIVFVVGLVGWNATSRLSEHIDTIGKNNLPSVEGLWKVNEGQTQIESSERLLLNPNLNRSERQAALTRIEKAWQQINEGFTQYESTPRSKEEEKSYQQMMQDWDKWKQLHEDFLRIDQNFEQAGIFNPYEVQLRLINQGKTNSPEMAAAKAASNLLTKLNGQARLNRVPFETAASSILKVVDLNKDQAKEALTASSRDINQTKFWTFIGMSLGPLSAILVGILLSIKIAKPLGAKIADIVNSIVSSATEIAATVEQQERTAAQQAVSVNQTTTTMDELGASSRTSAQQAEAAATGAAAVLNLVEGNQHDSDVFGQSSLRAKVGQITEQILRLSEQTQQIGSISTVVSELANQTNMLALNAAVEAVRAGENGKGFSVVASEIRKLAEQSKKSAERINALVIDIQNATNSTVMVTDEGRKTVETVVTAVNNIAMNTQQISLTAKQQAVAISQVVEAMNTLNQGASQTASGITQTKVGTQRLNEAAQTLKATV